MMEAGIVDPTKVTRSALQNAASISAMFLTTEAGVVEVKSDETAMPSMGGMGVKKGDGSFHVLVIKIRSFASKQLQIFTSLESYLMKC